MPQKYMIDATTLSAIADKIRSKLGNNDTMTPLQIPGKIDSIDSARYTAGYNAGDTAGYNRGYTAGESSGYSTGYSAGYSAGRSSGLADGKDSLSHFSYGEEHAAGQTGRAYLNQGKYGIIFRPSATSGTYWLISFAAKISSSAATKISHTVDVSSSDSAWCRIVSSNYNSDEGINVAEISYTKPIDSQGNSWPIPVTLFPTSQQSTTDREYQVVMFVIGPSSNVYVGLLSNYTT